MRIVGHNFEKGFSGEKEVRRMLEKALGGDVKQYQGESDKGLDLHVQMKNPYESGDILQFDVQVKTGHSHVIEESKKYKIKNRVIKSDGWSKLLKSRTPVLFVWLKDWGDLVAYWQFIKPSCISSFYISKHKTISPVSRYDIAREICARNVEKYTEEGTRVFWGDIGKSLRDEAKKIYKKLMKYEYRNPFLGKTIVTWHGWRHITNQSRAQYDIFKSLTHIYSIPTCIENPDAITGFRRVKDVVRGNRVNCVRLIVFEKAIKPEKTSPVVLVCVLRELIDYPKNWISVLMPQDDVKRMVILESIYEKKQ